jgi:flagellar biosynthesis protein
MSEPPSHPDISKKRARLTAAAVENDPNNSDLPKIVAAGRGKWAEQILELAFLNGIKVREDPALAEILASIELDSPIPTEAIMAVAEILAYVYEADGKNKPVAEDPFRVPEKQLEKKP